tara:strand:- start:603 stop:1187 length:585 start_codon:yes stop_codon:yes gene_type:complete
MSRPEFFPRPWAVALLAFSGTMGLGDASLLRDAADANDPAAVAAAIKAGADVNEFGADGVSILTHSTTARKFKAVNALLRAGADPNLGNRDTGRTAMHLAALSGDASLVKWLIKKGLQKSPVDHEGLTPLHCACQGSQKGNTDAAWALLDAGVAPDEPSTDGTRPIEFARANDSTRKLLQEMLAEKARSQRRAQ